MGAPLVGGPARLLEDKQNKIQPLASEMLEFFKPADINTSSNPPRIQYEYGFKFPFERNLDHEWISSLLQEFWWHTITISLIYFTVVKSIEVFMRDRKPFQLRYLLFAWNGALALFSLLGLIRTSEDFFNAVFNEGLIPSVCQCYEPSSVAAHWYLFFAISKIVELGDTVFLALRKRPLTFLHCYHHASVLIYTIHSGAEHIGAGRWFIWMNFVAHTLMYTYFAATSLGIRVHRTLAACTTLVQISQMIVGVGVTVFVYHIKTNTEHKCQQSFGNLNLAFTIYLSYAFLFIRFFIKAYISSPKERETVKMAAKKNN